MQHTKLFKAGSLLLALSLSAPMYAQKEKSKEQTIIRRNWDGSEDTVLHFTNHPMQTPNASIAFAMGDEPIVLMLGLQKNYSDKKRLPDLQAAFEDRIPHKRWDPNASWILKPLDNFSLSGCIALSKPETSDLTKFGAAYMFSEAGNALLGYDAFETPSIAELFKLSIAQGAVKLNLVSYNPERQKKRKPEVPIIASLDWSFQVLYTPVKLEADEKGIGDYLAKIAEKIEDLTNSLDDPLTSILNGRAIREDIRKLTDIAASLKEIPQTVTLRNLKMDYITDLLKNPLGIAGSEEDDDKKGKPLVLCYTGPSLSLGFGFPNTKAFSLSGYVQYLLPVFNKQHSRDQIYVVERKSLIDSADLYTDLLESLGIEVHGKDADELKQLEYTKPYKSRLWIFGFQLTAEFKGVNLYVGWQGVQQTRTDEDKYFKTTDDFSSSISIGGNLNLINIFRNTREEKTTVKYNGY